MKLELIGPGNWEYCISRLGNRKIAPCREVILDRMTKKDEPRQKRERYSIPHKYATGVWIGECINIVNGEILMARREYNPLILYAKEAAAAHTRKEPFYLNDSILIDGRPATEVLSEISWKDSNKPLHKRRIFVPKFAASYRIYHHYSSICNDSLLHWLAQDRDLPGKYLDFAYTFFRIDGMFVSFPDIDIGNSSWNIYFGGTSTNMNGNLTLLDSSYEEGHILASPLKNQPTSLMEKLKSWLKLRFRKRL